MPLSGPACGRLKQSDTNRHLPCILAKSGHVMLRPEPAKWRQTMPAVLVVDDDPDVRRLLRRLLVQRGWSVLEAASGGEAERMVRESSPDLLITDIFMAGGTGIELLQALSSHRSGHRPGPTVVVMSGDSHHDGVDQFALALRYGAAATLPKPFDAAALDAALSSRSQI